MGRKSKKNKLQNEVSAQQDIHCKLEAIEKQNVSVQKSISSFSARINVIRHLLNKI